MGGVAGAGSGTVCAPAPEVNAAIANAAPAGEPVKPSKLFLLATTASLQPRSRGRKQAARLRLSVRRLPFHGRLNAEEGRPVNVTRYDARRNPTPYLTADSRCREPVEGVSVLAKSASHP